MHKKNRTPSKEFSSSSCLTSYEPKPRLSALSRLAKQRKEWDDDENNQDVAISSTRRSPKQLKLQTSCQKIVSDESNTDKNDAKQSSLPNFYFGQNISNIEKSPIKNKVNDTRNSNFDKPKETDIDSPTKKLVWDKKLINSLESQGFKTLESKSKLVYEFDQDQKQSKFSPKKLDNCNEDFGNSSTPTPPPPPKVLSCVLKNSTSPDRSRSNVPHVNRSKRDLSPSKVSNLCNKWEEEIRNASPERQMDRKYSKSPRSFRPQENTRSPDRSRSPLKNFSSGNLKSEQKKVFSKSASNTHVISPSKYDLSTEKRTLSPQRKSEVVYEPINSSVKERAAVFDVGKKPPKDPTELSLQDRLEIFEKQKGSVSFKQKTSVNRFSPPKTPQYQTAMNKQKFAQSLPNKLPSLPNEPIEKSTYLNQTPVSSQGHGAVKTRKNVFENVEDDWQGNDINQKIQNERQKEMEVLLNRFKKPNSSYKSREYGKKVERLYPESDSDSIISEPDDRTTLQGPPKPPRVFVNNHSPQSIDESPDSQKSTETRFNSTELGESIRKEYVPHIKPGCLFPCLSDIESHSEIADSQESDDDDYKNSSFAESILTCASIDSLGTKIQRAAQNQISQALQTISEKPSCTNERQFSDTIDDMDAIDDAIDEALEDEPNPHMQANYNQGNMYTPSSRGNETDISLAHSISMYRKQKPAEINCTPVRRIVRPSETKSPEQSSPLSPSSNISVRIRELQEQENIQLSVISQASGAISVVSSRPQQQGTTQHIEAEKLLLVASQKRIAAQNEIQRLKAEGAGAMTSRSWGVDIEDLCRGSLCINNISLPLKEDFLTKRISASKVYHIMVLVKHRDQVITSQILNTPDCIVEKSVTFPNLIALHNLSSDFNVTLEVYMLCIEGSPHLQPFKKVSYLF